MELKLKYYLESDRIMEQLKQMRITLTDRSQKFGAIKVSLTIF